MGTTPGAGHAQDPGDAAARTAAARAFAGLAVAMLASSLGISIANVALPTLAEAFGTSFSDVRWVALAYLIATTTLVVGAGRLGDVAGRRVVLLVGFAGFTLASILCALAPTLWALVAGRALQGAAAAILTTLAVVVARETVPAGSIGSAMGALGTLSAVGTALGPSLGGFLIAGAGWRSIFLLLAILGAAGFVVTRRAPADAAPRAGAGRLDIRGTLLLAAVVAAYAVAMTPGVLATDDGDGLGLANLALLALAALGCGLLLRLERRSPAPLLGIAAGGEAGLGAGLAMNVLVSAVMMATLVVGPFFLAFRLGLDEVPIGLVMAIGPAVAAASGVPAGRATDRFGVHRTLLAGLAQLAAGAFALALLPPLLGTAGYVLGLVVLTPGYQLFLAALTTRTMTTVAAERRAVASGLLGLSRNLGFVTGASVLGSVFALTVGESDLATASPEALVRGWRTTFGVAGVLILAALAIAAARRAPHETGRTGGGPAGQDETPRRPTGSDRAG